MVRLLDELEVGLAAVDIGRRVVEVNESAAKLIGFPPGTAPLPQFIDALHRLADRSIEPETAHAQLRSISSDHHGTLKTTWRFPDAPTHLGVVSRPSDTIGPDGRLWAFYDNSVLAEAMETANRAHELLRVNNDAMLDPQVLMEAVRSDGRVVDLVYRDLNRAAVAYLDRPRDRLLDHSLLESLPSIVGSGLFALYSRCVDTGEPVVLDGFGVDNDMLGEKRYYDIRAARAGKDFISLTWRDVTERIEWEQRLAASEEGYRLLAENVGDVVARIRDDRIVWISNNVREAFGATQAHWLGRSVSEFVLPGEAEDYATLIAALGRGETYIGRARVVDANGVAHWIHLHVKPFYDAHGVADGIVASFRVIDDEVAAADRAQESIDLRDSENRSLTRRLQAQTDRLTSELSSAARYITSILPRELDGPVQVTSRHVPSQELAGDIYDYRWFDGDHLIVYLIDVSGHGVEPAMISVSVHNMLRFGTFDASTLLDPAAVLGALNRLFRMENHGENYFTAWYGVYQASTRTLRFACAGHPPALAFSVGPLGVSTAELGSGSLPIGIFDDTVYTTETFEVPADTALLLYSDGAYELSLRDGGMWSYEEFVALCGAIAESPWWTLDTMIAKLQAMTDSGLFDDDCSMVRLSIP